MSDAPKEYFQKIKNILAAHANPAIAEGQRNYMRNRFDFYGIKAPQIKSLAKELVQKHGLPEGENLIQVVRLCFEENHREQHYFALWLVEKSIKKQPPEFIGFLRELITTKSWWDSVDWLAKLTGIHLLRYPHFKMPVIRDWMDSGNFWLQRVAIIFQLSYKEKTDRDLLFQCILEVRNSKEFFLQKGAGWALRQFSKTDPQAVIDFCENHPDLPSLTRREGLKVLKKEGKIQSSEAFKVSDMAS